MPGNEQSSFLTKSPIIKANKFTKPLRKDVKMACSRVQQRRWQQGQWWNEKALEKLLDSAGNKAEGGRGAFKFSEMTESEIEWVAGWKWYDAIAARKNGTATQEQIELSDKGHWKEQLYVG